MPREPTVRELTSVDAVAVRTLLTEGFEGRGVTWTEEFWNWKHRDNPFGPSAGLIAEIDGRLAALRLFLHWELRCGNRTVRAVRAVDTVTHPDFRGRGLFSRLTRELSHRMRNEGVAFVFNTPNRNSRRGYLRLGWQKVGRLPLRISPQRCLASALWRRRRSPPQLSGFPTVTEWLTTPQASGWEHAWKGESRLHTVRTKAYLRWRYGEIPNTPYRALWTHEGDERAVLVFRARLRRGLAEITLSEILATPGSRGTRLAVDLLHHLKRKSNADYLLATAATDTPEARSLTRAGFLPLPGLGPLVTLRPLALEGDLDPTRWNHWRCSIGDLEVF